jgi:hypothetical protein
LLAPLQRRRARPEPGTDLVFAAGGHEREHLGLSANLSFTLRRPLPAGTHTWRIVGYDPRTDCPADGINGIWTQVVENDSAADTVPEGSPTRGAHPQHGFARVPSPQSSVPSQVSGAQ